MRLTVIVIAFAVLVGSAALGAPVAPIRTAHLGHTVPVGYGCGLGVRRGPLGACTPVYMYGGYDPYIRGYVRGYARGYYEGRRDAEYPYVRYYGTGDVVAVDRGFCGFASYLSCSHGTCWRFCY